MTKVELLEALADVPDDAIIYVEADHGQQPEKAHGVDYTFADFDDEGAPYYGDELAWQKSTKKRFAVSAVCIGF